MLISLNDCVARFIREEKHCKNGIIKPIVFTPRGNQTEISVFIVSDLSDSEIWQLGCRKLKRELIPARADLIVSSINEKGFDLQNGNGRHFGIIPIPKLPFPHDRDDPRNESAIRARREIAAKLIAISDLHIK